MTQQRAEALVKDLVKAGDVSKGKAGKALNDLMERSRKTTEDLRAIIRREIADQVETLGLATKDDIARLEAKIAAGPEPASRKTPKAGAAEPGGRPVRRAAPITKSATAQGPSGTAPRKRTSATKTKLNAPGPVPADSPDLRPPSGDRPDGGTP